MFLSGKDSAGNFLPPHLMMEDVMGDYHDQTVTIEDFPHLKDIRMVSIHPCKHAAVMKSLIHRANNALKLRREKQRMGLGVGGPQALDGLSGDMQKLKLADGVKSEPKGNAEDEWEVVDSNDNSDQDEVAFRADQYLVVFLKVRKLT
jgi:ubiquitin-like-conjugating enzyme ATG3